jgi:formylglycine-generating enzyme required for sulfatase activity/serine/threonine protein kinase
VLEKIGKYEIRLEIGRGAMGVVYEGFDPVIRRRVAIKILRTEMFEPGQLPDLLARFKREAQSAGRLSHPHIVTIHDYGEEQGTPYIVMEYMSGQELARQLQGGSRFVLDDVVRIMTALLGALAHAHEHGVVHRDLKPSNIFVLGDGSLKVVDFGIARVEASELTDTGTMLGTPAYMSPEQFLTLPVDARSDLYSAGVILYQLLTGDKPFTGSVTAIMQKVLHQEPIEPSMLNPTLSKHWDAVVSRAMAKKPEARYQTAPQFLEAVKAAHAAERGEQGASPGNAVAPRERMPGEAHSSEKTPRRGEPAGHEAERTLPVRRGPDPDATVPSPPKAESGRSPDAGEAPRSRKGLAIAAGLLAVLGLGAGFVYLHNDSSERASIERARQEAERRAADAEERARKETERANQEAQARTKTEAARTEDLRRGAEADKARALKEAGRAKQEAEAARREEALRRETDAARAAAEVARKEAENKTRLAALRAEEATRQAALAKKQTEDKARAEAAKKDAARKAEEARKAEKARAEQALRERYKAGTTFGDCPDCPQMVVIPAGEFTMGSPQAEAGRSNDEGPQRAVRIARPFALGRNEVTFGQFQRFAQEAGYATDAERDAGSKGCFGFNYSDRTATKSDWRPGRTWRNPGFEQNTDRDPVVCVSWNDAKAYIRWLSGKTGKAYRLPTEAEWEYAARAGTTTSHHWGEDPGQACLHANVADQSIYRTAAPPGTKTWSWPTARRHECDDGRYLTAPAGSYRPNGFGLYDMLGNAWEWNEDCWTATYAGAPADGSAWLSGDCTRRVVRGGSWNTEPHSVRSAKRARDPSDHRSTILGFRLARTLE